MKTNVKAVNESRFRNTDLKKIRKSESHLQILNKLIFLIFCFWINYSLAMPEVITTIDDGEWSDPEIWDLNRIPASNDSVIIAGDFEVEADIDTTCLAVTILAPVSSNGSVLIINDVIHLKIKNNLTIYGGNGNNKKTSLVFLGNGQVTVGKNLIINSPDKQNAVIDMSDGSSRINIGNKLILNGNADWLAGSNSIINFNGTVSQIVPASYGLKFANLHLNNTSTDGVKLDANITNQIVTGNIRVQSGIFDNAGFAISGNGNTQGNGVSKIFEIADFARYILQGSSNFPTGFSNIILGAKSTVQYNGSGSQTIRSLNYGNLESSNTGDRTLDNSAAIGIAGNFIPGSNSYIITNSTINYNGAIQQTISAFNYFNLASSNTGSRTIQASGKIRIANSFNPGINPFTITNSTIEFNGTTSQTIPAFNYFNLNSTSTGTRILDNAGIISIKGNFNVGSNNYQSSGSSLVLDGGISQNITGSISLEVKNFTINNNSGIFLKVPLKINSSLQFTSGIIYNDSSSTVIFDSLASSSGASSSNFINGPVTWITNRVKSYSFPTGKNNLFLPVIITTLIQGEGTITAEYFDNSFTNTSSISAELSRVSSLEYFSVKKTGTVEATITLNWHAGSDVNSTAINDLRVASWDGSIWQNAGNTVVSGNGNAGSITSQSRNSFNAFTLGSVGSNNPLPVELLFFNASSSFESVVLKWATASEQNSSYFTLERSADQLNFSPIGSIDANGFSNGFIQYEFMDNDPLETDAYYRLSQTDMDGTAEIFPIIFVKKDNHNELLVKQVFPNPIQTGANAVLKILSSNGAVIDLRILDLNGSIIYAEQFNIEVGREKNIKLTMLDLLSSGVYILQVADQLKLINNKIVKI